MKPRHLITRPLRGLLRMAGLEVAPLGFIESVRAFPYDFSETDIEDFRAVEPYTMVPRERILTLVRAIEHVVKNGIPGTVLECGTWKGGCAMAMARALNRLRATGRELCLYDLFGELWPAHTAYDAFRGVPESERNAHITQVPEVMRYTLEEVRENVLSTGFPADKLHMFRGAVERTLPANAPEKIAVLRLDTDFYESTLHELTHLYPRLQSGGLLIIDDYGDWAGARKAVDEYMGKHGLNFHLFRVDEGARMAVKP